LYDKSLQQLDEPAEDTAFMLPSEERREEKERQAAEQQSFNSNEAYAQPEPNASAQQASGFGDKISAFFSGGGGGKSRGQDQGEIAFGGNPANDTVTAKGSIAFASCSHSQRLPRRRPASACW
jgi:hypothetical protein